MLQRCIRTQIETGQIEASVDKVWHTILSLILLLLLLCGRVRGDWWWWDDAFIVTNFYFAFYCCFRRFCFFFSPYSTQLPHMHAACISIYTILYTRMTYVYSHFSNMWVTCALGSINDTTYYVRCTSVCEAKRCPLLPIFNDVHCTVWSVDSVQRPCICRTYDKCKRQPPMLI